MSSVIIGIHGRAPKPPEKQEQGWWRRSILEGLVHNERRQPENDIPFEIAYYADIFKPPLPEHLNDEPYDGPADRTVPFPLYRDGWQDDIARAVTEMGGWTLDALRAYIGLDGVLEAALKKITEDLYLYYTQHDVRKEVQDRLRKVLDRHLGKSRVMLIAHSMGAIVAYDVLRMMGRETPAGTVQHFITIGAPLGLPHVKYMIHKEHDLARTPSIVERWTNFSDRRDFVCVNTHLSDDFAPSVSGVKVFDDLVFNTYKSQKTGRINPHKSYGYLRTPELSKAVRQFL